MDGFDPSPDPAMPTKPKYKVCKNCGNRNHPDSRQCPWCGAPLRGRTDWFATFALLFIAAVVVILIACTLQSRSLSPRKIHLPASRSTG